jgi:hypothetical protein
MLERKIENMSLNLTSVDQNEQEIMKIKPIRCESGGMDRMEGINGRSGAHVRNCHQHARQILHRHYKHNPVL